MHTYSRMVVSPVDCLVDQADWCTTMPLRDCWVSEQVCCDRCRRDRQNIPGTRLFHNDVCDSPILSHFPDWTEKSWSLNFTSTALHIKLDSLWTHLEAMSLSRSLSCQYKWTIRHTTNGSGLLATGFLSKISWAERLFNLDSLVSSKSIYTTDKRFFLSCWMYVYIRLSVRWSSILVYELPTKPTRSLHGDWLGGRILLCHVRRTKRWPDDNNHNDTCTGRPK